MEKLWQLRQGQPNSEAEILQETFADEFGKLLGRFLTARNFREVDRAREYLQPKISQLPSPFTLKNLQASAEILAGIVRQNSPLLIYGDYDVDGMSGLTLAADFFTKIGFINYRCYQPHRFNEGYGVHVSSLEKFYAEFPFAAVVTVDTGITAVDPALWLKNKNIPFIISDHHLSTAELPDTPFIVNPNQAGCSSGLGMLCGTAVLFFLLAGVKNILRLEIKLDEFLDLVALATVADQMELTGVNRSLVREGLKRFPKNVRPGLKALTKALGEKVSARDLAFSVAPRLNAASRLGQVEKALQLLQSKDDAAATSQLQKIEELNDLRVASQAKVLLAARKEALTQFENDQNVLIVQGADWAEGVLGIVAAKIVDEFSLPTIVLSQTEKGTLRGSMRSPDGFHSLAFLEGGKDFLIKFGGHAAAAGVELELSKLSAFEAYAKTISVAPQARPTEYDGNLSSMPTLTEVAELAQAEPFGRGNEAAMFLIPNLGLAGRRIMKERHVKWDFQLGCAIGFGLEALCQKLEKVGHQEVDALVVPEIQEFRGRRSVQLRICHLRPSGQASDTFS